MKLLMALDARASRASTGLRCISLGDNKAIQHVFAGPFVVGYMSTARGVDATCPFGIGAALAPATASASVANMEILILDSAGCRSLWFCVLFVSSSCLWPAGGLMRVLSCSEGIKLRIWRINWLQAFGIMDELMLLLGATEPFCIYTTRLS